MAEIMQVFSLERRLYSPESIPWVQVLLPTNLRRLQERYKFSEMGQGQMQADPTAGASTVVQVVGSRGELSVGGEVRAVQQLIIEPNAAQCQVAGETAVAETLLEDVEQFFREIDPTKKLGLQEYTRSYQTVAIAKLSVPFDAIFSENMRRFLGHNIPQHLRVRDAQLDVGLAHLSWQVKYKADTTDYMYLPKTLGIEPLPGSKLSQNVYHTQSPTDSETHRRLLEDFESTLSSQTVGSGA